MRGNAVRDAVALRGDARGGRVHTVLAGLPLRRGGEYDKFVSADAAKGALRKLLHQALRDEAQHQVSRLVPAPRC